MQGHYTGAWHADATYDFAVHFAGTGVAATSDWIVELNVTIDGSLDLTVAASGTVTGSASGDVQAPERKKLLGSTDWQTDIAGGIGTVSGQISGVLGGTNSVLTLSSPIIEMHWGTFGGRAIETQVTMPDYHLVLGSQDCVSSQGNTEESGFPTMFVTNDATGQMAQAPGVGDASGSWQMTSDAASKFHDFSVQVNTLLNTATNLLSGDSFTTATINTKILQPLQQLEAAIQADPHVSRCLLDRIATWEKSTLPALFERVKGSPGGPSLASLRAADDILRSAQMLNLDCALSDDGAAGTMSTAIRKTLDRAVAGENWTDAALLARELLLFQPDRRDAVQQQLHTDVHALVVSVTDKQSLLALGRVAYAFGDDEDAGAIAKRLESSIHPDTKIPGQTPAGKRHRHKHHKPKPKPTPMPPRPQSVVQVLGKGLTSISVSKVGGATPSFSWTRVDGASSYLVTVAPVNASPLAWSWAGSQTSVTYGDTALDGIPGSGEDGWSDALPSPAVWSILAFNSDGQIIAARFRVAL